MVCTLHKEWAPRAEWYYPFVPPRHRPPLPPRIDIRMTRSPIDTPKNTPAAPQKPADALSHQERVYFEMFRAIEQLGRKLEKAEAERFILARRLSDIEDSAERDENTGRLYLPAKIESAIPPPPSAAQRFALPAALASLVLALLTLGAVLMQDLPQSTAVQAPRSAAASFMPPLPQQPAEGLTRMGWHSRIPAEETARAAQETVSAEAALTPQPSAPFAELSPAVDMPKPLTPERETEAAKNEAYDADDFDTHLADADFDAHLADALEDLTSKSDMAFLAEETANPIAAEMALTEPSAPHSALDESDAELFASGAAAQVSAAPPPAPEAAKQAAAPAEKPATTVSAAPSQDSAPAPQTPLMRDARLPPPLAALEARAFEGMPEAQHDLATIYAEGRRVRQDYARARAWFARAADAGIANAHYNLGVMSQQGLGMPAHAAAARGHYERAAQLGHPEAMYNLGLVYAEGRGVPKNTVRAASYFKRAANAGMVQAAYNLGVIYETDALGKPDIKAAIEWYDVAAAEGNRDAALAVRRLTRLQQAEASPSLR